MKKSIVLILTLFATATSSFAEEKKIEYKNWKIFQSDYGYEFKYPDCWEVIIDTPEEEGDIHQIKDIAVLEGDGCRTEKLHKDLPNGIGISAAWEKIKSPDEYASIVEKKKKWVNEISKTNYSLLTKDSSAKDSYSYTVVNWGSSLKKDVVWEVVFFCPTFKIRLRGPTITHPDQSFLDEFKKGNLALPEPYKTIYESIKCIEPKINTKKEVLKKKESAASKEKIKK